MKDIRSWLRALVGACLAAIMVGGPVMVAGGSAALASTIPTPPVSAGAPGAPIGLTATAGNAQVTLSWTAPASDGASLVSGYDVYMATSADFTGDALVAAVTSTAVVLADLASGTSYYFRVAALNGMGESPLSAEASATVPVPLVARSSPPASSVATPSGTAPTLAAPTGLTATAGNAEVHLSWTAPASDGGTPVSGYKIYVAAAPGAPASAAIGTTTGTGGIVTGLVNGTTYYFRVTAVNAAGRESPFSTAVSAEPATPATGAAVSLNSPRVPGQLIALLAVVSVAAAVGVLTLIVRRRRRLRSPDLDRPAPATRPDVAGVHDTGREPVYTVRSEPDSGVITTTIKEGRS